MKDFLSTMKLEVATDLLDNENPLRTGLHRSRGPSTADAERLTRQNSNRNCKSAGASDDCLYGSNIEGSMALSYSNDAKVMFCPARFFEIQIATPVITTGKVGHNFVLCRCPPPLFTRHVLVDRPKFRHHSSSWLLSV